MTKDQSESLTLKPETNEVKLNNTEKSQADCSVRTSNGDDPQILNSDQIQDTKVLESDFKKTLNQKSSLVNDLEKVEIEKLNDDLKLKNDDPKLINDDLKLKNDDLKLKNDDPKLKDDDLKLKDDDLELKNLKDDDSKLRDDDLKLKNDDLKLKVVNKNREDDSEDLEGYDKSEDFDKKLEGVGKKLGDDEKKLEDDKKLQDDKKLEDDKRLEEDERKQKDPNDMETAEELEDLRMLEDEDDDLEDVVMKLDDDEEFEDDYENLQDAERNLEEDLRKRLDNIVLEPEVGTSLEAKECLKASEVGGKLFEEEKEDVGPFEEGRNEESLSEEGEGEKGTEGPSIEGLNKRGSSEEGLNEENPNKEGSSEEGSKEKGLSKKGLSKEGLRKEDLKEDLNKEDLNKEGSNKKGLNKEDLNKEGLNKEGSNKKGLNKEDLNKEASNKKGLNKEDLNKEGLNKKGLNEEDLNKEGLNNEALNKEGLNKERIKSLNKEDSNKEGLNNEALNKEGLNKERIKSLNKEDSNKEGLNNEALNREGLNKERLNKEGLNKEDLHKEGPTKESLNKGNLNRKDTNKEDEEGTVKQSSNKRGTNKEELNEECSNEGSNKEDSIRKNTKQDAANKESLNNESLNKENRKKEDTNKECSNKIDSSKEGLNKEVSNKAGSNQDCLNKESANKDNNKSLNKESSNNKSLNKDSSNNKSLNKESSNKKSSNKEDSTKEVLNKESSSKEVSKKQSLNKESLNEDLNKEENPEIKESLKKTHEENSTKNQVPIFETVVPDDRMKSLETTAKRKEVESKFEVGIVGEPTAVTELINDDELRTESALPTEGHDHVAQWIENFSKLDGQFSDDEMENLEELPDKKIKRKQSDRSEFISTKRRHIVQHIIKRSIKCLNKMHAMDESGANGKKVEAAEKKEEEDSLRKSPQVPQSQQNGAALPEETAAAAADRLHSSAVKEEPYPETGCDATKNSTTDPALPKQTEATRNFRPEDRGSRKRRSTEEVLSANGNSSTKRICVEQRDQLVSSLITGYESASADELASRADILRAELHALDELARAAEMEWNRVLTMRKLKEEAYMRIERRRQVVNFMEGHDRLNDMIPPSNLEHDLEARKHLVTKDKFPSREEHGDNPVQQDMSLYKHEKMSKSQQAAQNLSRNSLDAKKHADMLAENRQIGEGRQGPIVDVRSIIADYRLRHPETVPRRGRRMRNSVNVNLGAGGAMVETSQNADSRPSSTDSCKSNSNTEPNMSFKDVLVQFAKLSQQQGEAVKTPQNYPDVTLHPVAPSPTTQSSAPQQTGSLLHGILTKAQSPRPTTFSPTLARLLTAPERERNAPNTTVTPHPNSRSQRLLHAYQEPNPVSISDLLSSSKGRTEITITPVVNPPVHSHLNNMIHVDDEDETALMEERESRITGGNRDDREISPRCQGCHERAAQYVCAGCGNQWYCSPECQAAAWDEHSEVCSG